MSEKPKTEIPPEPTTTTKSTTATTVTPSSPTPPSTAKSITEKIANTVTTGDSLPPSSESEKISANARVVILGLFSLVGFLVLLFAITISRTSTSLSDTMVQVFTAAITGAFTLGGVLITQLWGK